MVIPGIVILPLLLTQVLSAPSRCIESCGSYVKQYQTQSSGSIQNQGALAQDVTRLQVSTIPDLAHGPNITIMI